MLLLLLVHTLLVKARLFESYSLKLTN